MRVLFFNRYRSSGYQVKSINFVKSVITGLHAFNKAGFAERIGYHIANFYVL